jgi:hypothetical protein
MNTSLALQYAIVAVIVAFAATSVLRKYLPSVWGRALARIADALESPRAPTLARKFGARLRARIPASVGGGCAASGGCSSCGACATTPEAEPATMTLAEPKPLRRA